MIKFSKSYSNIFKIKEDYIKKNIDELRQVKKINNYYKKQKIRKNCKICFKKLRDPLINSFGVDYYFCKNCDHLNGKYEDTPKFHDFLYSGKGKLNFGKIYLKNYDKILKNIHHPKVKFLKSIIKKKINLLDFGAGAGHFVKACLNQKINAWALEENYQLYKFSKIKIKERSLYAAQNNLEEVIKKFNINCLSLIFVLEHLPNPHYIFELFKKTQLEYLYISVPLASPLIFFENIFQNVYPRHLGGAHTHLFTENSILYLKKKYKFKIIGEWWFGTEFADLYRSLIVSYKGKNTSCKKIYKSKIDKIFLNTLDTLQTVFDKQKLSSEVHLVIKK